MDKKIKALAAVAGKLVRVNSDAATPEAGFATGLTKSAAPAFRSVWQLTGNKAIMCASFL